MEKINIVDTTRLLSVSCCTMNESTASESTVCWERGGWGVLSADKFRPSSHSTQFDLPSANTYNSDCNKLFALMAAKLVGPNITLCPHPLVLSQYNSPFSRYIQFVLAHNDMCERVFETMPNGLSVLATTE